MWGRCFFGGGVPFVLRPELQEGCYYLVGECFVEGCGWEGGGFESR
jgi:hypothetical protein